MSETKKPTAAATANGYEATDANVGILLKFGVSLLIVTGVALASMFVLLNVFNSLKAKTDTAPHQLAAESQLPQGLRLQVTPEHDYEAFNAEQDSLLHSYGWLQQEAGVVRVPIDSAMALLLQRGLPARQDSSGGQR